MFLFKRTTLVLLMITFGILLPPMHIQPAQALMCYGCDLGDEEYVKCIHSDAPLKNKITCHQFDTSCYKYETRYLDRSAPIFSRGCGNSRYFNSSLISCQEFKPNPPSEFGPSESKKCFCETDLCNNASRIRILTQLLFFSILACVSASWINS